MHRLLPALIVLVSIGSLPSNLRQYQLLRVANAHEENGDIAGAVRMYHSLLDRYPDGIFRREILFNLADTEYVMKHYLRSAGMFDTIPAGNPEITRLATYNKGNALAMTAFGNPKALDYPELLSRSLACYRIVLLSDPRNTDARINYEIVRRALRKLSPPPPSPSPASSDKPAAANRSPQSISINVANMILDNAQQNEALLMRKYFHPIPARRTAEEEEDW
jgi:hypothetical protein